MKNREIIEKILAYHPHLPGYQGCDDWKSGDPEAECTGIVTALVPTVNVIRKTAELGANLLIVHEPAFYTSADKGGWFEDFGNAVYEEKQALIDRHGITIWRLHDHMHMGSEIDYIYEGLIEALGWREYLQKDEPQPWIYEIPETTLRKLAEEFKDIFHMDTIQIIGSPDMKVRRVGILVGGGSLGLGVEVMPMQVMERDRLDLMVVGDITEWTICAYLNDAYQMGFNKGMLTLGHERSEEFGMKYMEKWLQERFSDFPITFIDAKEPFGYL